MNLRDAMIFAIHRAILANPARVSASLSASAKSLEKAEADWYREYVGRRMGEDDYWQVYANYWKAEAGFKNTLAAHCGEISEILAKKDDSDFGSKNS